MSDWDGDVKRLAFEIKAVLDRLQAAEAVLDLLYSDYFEAINTVEDEEDFPDWCLAYRKWRESKTGECAIHMEECECLKPDN